jgi:glucose-6-phosphate isomerase
LKAITFDYQHALKFVNPHEMQYISDDIVKAHRYLHQATGQGHDFLGWVDLPTNYDKQEYEKIKKAAKKIRSDSDILIVIGIGGSYLGAKAAIHMLTHSFSHLQSNNGPQVLFAGNHISSTYLFELLEVLEGKEISLNVISKSGTTTEPALAFRVLREFMENKYKDKANDRIYVTTDAKKGALKKFADQKGYQTFVIPDDVGGRFSVLTAVGLLPIAVAGIDIDGLIQGAQYAYSCYNTPNLEINTAYQYSALRNIFYRKGFNIELLVNYEPSLQYFSEWWKQLFGESEGKDHKGLFPASVNFTTDLHSMGQYIQDGRRQLFETVLVVEEPSKEIVIPNDPQDIDGLNYLAGKTMSFVNQKAFEGTLLAHTEGEVPNLVIRIPEISPYYFGCLVYFFEKACGISGYLLGVNPFDQPGVEAYKSKMFSLLGKPGYKS